MIWQETDRQDEGLDRGEEACGFSRAIVRRFRQRRESCRLHTTMPDCVGKLEATGVSTTPVAESER